MMKIQNYVMQDGDQDKTSSVDERPAISEPLPPLVGPLGETMTLNEPSGKSFQEDAAKKL